MTNRRLSELCNAPLKVHIFGKYNGDSHGLTQQNISMTARTGYVYPPILTRKAVVYFEFSESELNSDNINL